MTNRELGTVNLTTTADRKARIVELRRQGITFAKIADEIGITRQGAHDLYWAAMREHIAPNAAEIRAEQNERLNYMYERAAEIEQRKHVLINGGKVVHEQTPLRNADGTFVLDNDGAPVMTLGEPLIDDGPQLRALAEMRAIEAERAKLNGTYAPVVATINGEVRYEIAGGELDLSKLR